MIRAHLCRMAGTKIPQPKRQTKRFVPPKNLADPKAIRVVQRGKNYSAYKREYGYFIINLASPQSNHATNTARKLGKGRHRFRFNERYHSKLMTVINRNIKTFDLKKNCKDQLREK